MYQLSTRRSRRRGAAVRATVGVALAGALAATGTLPARAGPAAVSDAAAAADTSPPRVEDIRFSRASVRVSGLNVVPVTVSVHLTDATGVREIPHAMTPSPELTLTPVPGFQSKLRPVLSRTSGTVTDGVWSATIHVPSTWNGTVRVTSVGAEDRAGNLLSEQLTGAQSPALRVRGTHRPALTFHYSLLAGGGFRIHGRAFFTDTRRPIARRPLATSHDSGCDFDGGAVNNIVTDARGYYEMRRDADESGTAGCVALIGRAAPGQRPTLLTYAIAWAPQPAIPDAALLQPHDLHGATFQPLTDDGYWSGLLPPRPCAGGPFGSTALRRADRSGVALFGVDDDGPPNAIVEHVATYRSNGAHRYMRELRRALRACDGLDQHGTRWTVLATGIAGDESLLLRRRTYLDYAGTYQNTYLMVARTGRVLVVVHDTGWETASGDATLARDLGTTAVRRADILNQR
jgi:hypothetical protein